MTFTSADRSAGGTRMKELAKENAAAVALWTKLMIEGLGRETTAVERVTAELIAGHFIAARRCRDKGNARGDVEHLREAALLMRNSVFRHPATASPVTAAQ